MKETQYKDFKEGMVGVMSLYSKDLSNFGMDIWWGALRGYDLNAVKDAFNRYVVNPDTGQFPPKPADIVRMLQGSSLDSAMQAWSKVDKALRTVGTYKTVAFDDPLIHVVLQEMGGWISLGDKTEDEWPFVAKEFENRYRGYKGRNELPKYRKTLTGLFDASNVAQGYKEQDVVLIGDTDKARMVISGGIEHLSIQLTQLSEIARLKKPEENK